MWLSPARSSEKQAVGIGIEAGGGYALAMRFFLLAALVLAACSNVQVVDDDGNGGQGGIPDSGGAPGFGGQDPCLNGSCSGGFGSGGAPPEDALYFAQDLPTGAPRFLITKVVPSRGLCLHVLVEAGLGQGFPIETNQEWTVSQIFAIQDDDECDLFTWPAPPEATLADVASGTLIGKPGPDCTVDIHVSVDFPSSAAWLEEPETIDADGLTVVGGCF